jgi:hypothetical protein
MTKTPQRVGIIQHGGTLDDEHGLWEYIGFRLPTGRSVGVLILDAELEEICKDDETFLRAVQAKIDVFSMLLVDKIEQGT